MFFRAFAETVIRPLLPLIFITTAASVFSQNTKTDDPIFARDSFNLAPISCPFKNEIKFEKQDIECFLLEVPENREKPDSRYIELHIVKLNAKVDDVSKEEEKASSTASDASNSAQVTQPEPGKRDDPVVYLTGGPGAKVTTYVKRFKDHGLLKHRDLYIIEQRGIGFSDDFCPEYALRYPHIDNKENFIEQQQANNQRAKYCAENAQRAGVDLTGYNTIENARDVQALRLALGLNSWNVWGISYGSILGQAYVKQDEAAIEAIAIDAIMPINARDNALHWRVTKWYHRVLTLLDEACQEHAECGSNYPNLADRVRAAVMSVDDQGLELTVPVSAKFPEGKAYLHPDLAGMAPFSLFYEQSNYAALPALIEHWSRALETKNTDLLALLFSTNNSFFSSSRGMRDAILCNDGGFDSIAASLKTDHDEFPVLAKARGSTTIAETFAQQCRELGMTPRPSEQYQLAQTDVPALIIEGDMDPITPPPLAEVILPGFTNATYVEFPYAGHGPSRSVKCAGDMLNLFYDNPDKTPDLSCTKTMKAPDFVAPLFKSSIVAQLGSRFFNDKKQLILPGAWLLISSLVMAISVLVFFSQAITRRLDSREAFQTDGARLLTFLTATAGFAGLVIYFVAGFATYQHTAFLMLFGLVPLAKWAVVFTWVAVIFGILGIWRTWQVHRNFAMPTSTLIGFNLCNLAAIAFWLFTVVWDLNIF
ncbi:MAG: alpha/beta fold hydrolase [Gammaproteobacteria bacterium]|nr:alpha/beta fold hydrolase [Gammaproteobacteria bacterium]